MPQLPFPPQETAVAMRLLLAIVRARTAAALQLSHVFPRGPHLGLLHAKLLLPDSGSGVPRSPPSGTGRASRCTCWRSLRDQPEKWGLGERHASLTTHCGAPKLAREGATKTPSPLCSGCLLQSLRDTHPLPWTPELFPHPPAVSTSSILASRSLSEGKTKVRTVPGL